jgi:hypothetical protein
MWQLLFASLLVGTPTAADLPKAADAEIVFKITEGPEVKLKAIQIRGNKFACAQILTTQINSARTILGVGGTFNRSVANADAA